MAPPVVLYQSACEKRSHVLADHMGNTRELIIGSFLGKSIDRCSPERFKRDSKIDERKVGRRWLKQERNSERKPKKRKHS
jgi:hypothetical protein